MYGDARHGTLDGGSRARVRAIPGIGRPPWLLPLALIALGVIFDLLTPASLLVGSLAAAPMAAAALWTGRGTVLTGALSTVSAFSLVVWANVLTVVEGVVRVVAVFTVSLLAVAVHHALHHSELRLASVRRVAEAVQLAVLPVPPSRIGDLTLAVRYEAAQVNALIGGDMYGVQQTPHGVRMLVGDVRGKGLDAVAAVTVVFGAFREAAETEPDLGAVADRLEHALVREMEQRGGAGRVEGFVTAVLAEVPAGAPGTLRIVNRGHPPPLLLSADGSSVRVLEPDSYALPLGLGELAGGGGHADPVPFPPGALLLLYTDGLTEARNTEGAFYDPVARLRGRRFAEPGLLLDALVADIDAYTAGGTDDDMAMLAVMRDPVPPAAARSPSVSGTHPSA
ncbi:PP2C family protein-serine/threonine phosphatase [Streptomyces macrosporus]|uniref:PP2C family protein-serine/threonine phosphatase n=1 Tax=Streptomyces macrosporus TaxID=44032 RepID=A0ABN3KK09_9ACTN